MTHDGCLYSYREEVANTVTSIVGCILSVPCLLYYFNISKEHPHEFRYNFSLLLYTGSLVTVWMSITCYHLVGLIFTSGKFAHTCSKLTAEKLYKFFRTLDYVTIYLLIAGTYTPVANVLMKDHILGQTILYTVWTVSIVAIFLNFVDPTMRDSSTYQGKVQMLMYIVLASLGNLAIPSLILEGFMTMYQVMYFVIGNIAYGIGLLFHLGRLRHVKFSHAIWHVGVLLGSFSHFYAIFISVKLDTYWHYI